MTQPPATLSGPLTLLALLTFLTVATPPAPAAAQVRVATLALGDSPVSATDQIRVSRFADFTEVDSLAVGDRLAAHDQITALSTDVAIELECANGSLLHFADGFRVLIAGKDAGDCAFTVTAAGEGDVLTVERTQTDIGGNDLITKGTRYAFRLRREGGRPSPEILVFEGEVEVEVAGRAESVAAGKTFDLAPGDREIATRPVSHDQVVWWAQRYAAFEVVKARAASPELTPESAERLRSKLTELHSVVLQSPASSDSRVALARTQIAHGLAKEALYQLQEAGVEPSGLRQIQPELLHKRDPATLEQIDRLIRDNPSYPFRPAPSPASSQPDTRMLFGALDRKQYEEVAKAVKKKLELGDATPLDACAGAMAYGALRDPAHAAELARWALATDQKRPFPKQDSLSEECLATCRRLAAAR